MEYFACSRSLIASRVPVFTQDFHFPSPDKRSWFYEADSEEKGPPRATVLEERVFRYFAAGKIEENVPGMSIFHTRRECPSKFGVVLLWFLVEVQGVSVWYWFILLLTYNSGVNSRIIAGVIDQNGIFIASFFKNIETDNQYYNFKLIWVMLAL